MQNFDIIFGKRTDDGKSTLSGDASTGSQGSLDKQGKNSGSEHSDNGDSADASAELRMQVSGVCKKGGRKVAYVTFSEGKRVAEGEIPKCRINKSEGFSEKEVAGLEFYMKQNLDMLKKIASAINPIKAMMR